MQSTVVEESKHQTPGSLHVHFQGIVKWTFEGLNYAPVALAVSGSVVVCSPSVRKVRVLGTCFVMQYFVSFLVCNHPDGKESWLLDFYCLLGWCHMAVSVLCLFLAVPCVGLQCVIVTFPYLTHLLVMAQ